MRWVRRILSLLERALNAGVDRVARYPQAEAPFRRFVLLRLDGAEPRDDRGGGAMARRNDGLIPEPLVGDGLNHRCGLAGC